MEVGVTRLEQFHGLTFSNAPVVASCSTRRPVGQQARTWFRLDDPVTLAGLNLESQAIAHDESRS